MPEPMTDSGAAQQRADQRLFEAVRSFVALHGHPGVVRFCDGLANWGSDWIAVAPRPLPASDTLARAAARPDAHALAALFASHRASRKWERTYTADDAVGADMLAGYGFTELVGPHGPFLSNLIRAGIGVWGPHIVYPPHRHRAEEAYVVLAGAAVFTLGAGGRADGSLQRAGDVVHVPSMTTHGFATDAEPLVVLYLWQGGDLREKSRFA